MLDLLMQHGPTCLSEIERGSFMHSVNVYNTLVPATGIRLILAPATLAATLQGGVV